MSKLTVREAKKRQALATKGAALDPGCLVPKGERTDYVQELVLNYFSRVVQRPEPITLATSLGPAPGGLGHAPAKRKLYYYGLRDDLKVKGCAMLTLGPNHFGDTDRYATVGDIAKMVEEDLG